MSKIIKLDPFISYTIWGGDKLSQIKNIKTSKPIGETWEVSTHCKGSSTIGSQSLADLINLSYLVKFIDTRANLSIQVHPNDEYAKKYENDSGKTECWIILECEKEAGIYLGLKSGITKKEFKTALENNLEINNYLNFVRIKAGDFFIIPAGTIHAIGAGVTLFEVQQSSGVTYRVWDWNRLGLDGKPRELHIDKALDVINFDKKFNNQIFQKTFENIFKFDGVRELVKFSDFKCELIQLVEGKKLELNLKAKQSLTLFEGRVTGDIELNRFSSAICTEAGVVSFDVLESGYLVLVS